ncbi:phage regulatory CII family protein [Stakelama tenebrarum]|uniref:Uncharacterized protein n=1 Tax=Stakelama tenebrarum TaxID=2711215 RepID=A0A6G6Y588_9SPHN|nr:phage regulatory CII family protein [Sphingosinithalassobacter tenebrarum]QIG79967.1 hypothetical protein G5C33_09390 [Sphingosinithalassobacter tenebrarum]
MAELSQEERSLALATKRAVQAAGGLEACSAETGLSTSQLSRCGSAHDRDSLTLRDAATITQLGAGEPHMLNALARIAGGVFMMLPQAGNSGSVESCLIDLASEFGAEAQSVREAMADREWTRGELADALDRLDRMDGASARLRHALNQLHAGMEGRR